MLGGTSLQAKGKTMENIPPKAAALSEHIKRSVLQARKWYHCLEATRVDHNLASQGLIPSRATAKTLVGAGHVRLLKFIA